MENKYIKEFTDYIKVDSEKEECDKEVLAYLIDSLIKLWYEPKETLDSFRKWFWKRISKYNITVQQLEHCIDTFYDYWSEEETKTKNFKTRFFNNPYLRPFIKSWYEYKNNINNIH